MLENVAYKHCFGGPGRLPPGKVIENIAPVYLAGLGWVMSIRYPREKLSMGQVA